MAELNMWLASRVPEAKALMDAKPGQWVHLGQLETERNVADVLAAIGPEYEAEIDVVPGSGEALYPAANRWYLASVYARRAGQ